MKKVWLILPILVVFTATAWSGCGPETLPVAPNDPSVASKLLVHPESDNGYRWSSDSGVEVETTVYTVTVIVNDELQSNSTIQGSGSGFMYGGYGSASMRIWQEGKGLLPVTIVSISPEVPFVPAGATIVLKTSDLKAMGLPNGASTVFICNMDTEVLSPVQDLQVLTTDRLTKELDDCRMLYPTYTSSGQ